MPHKDRSARLAYLRAWKAAHRPAPAPIAQDRDGLPPLGQVVFSEDGEQVQCHVCGAWLGSLNMHLRTHDLDAAAYKAAFDLKRTVSLWPPALKAKQRAAALERGQGDIGRDNLPRDSRRPAGLAARLSNRIEASLQRQGVYTRGGAKTRGPS